MNRRAVLELSGLAAGVVMSGAAQAAAPPKRFLARASRHATALVYTFQTGAAAR